MLNLTRLLCGTATEGDGLRYGEDVSQFRNAPHAQAAIHHRPVVVWNSTRRCNLHCMHCYTDSLDKNYPGELSNAEAKGFIKDLAQYGSPVLLFSGGEPLVRPDLIELVTEASGLGLRAVLSTNGTLITPAIVQALGKAGISYMGISLDGLQPTHDKLRGKQGAFQESLRGIRLCQDAGIKVGVRFTLTSRNVDELDGLFNLVEDLNIQRMCIYHLVYSGRGAKIMALDLPHEERRAAVASIFEHTVDYHRRGLVKEILTVDNHADAPFMQMWADEHLPERSEEIRKLLRHNGGNSSGVGIGNVDNLGYVHPDQFWHQVMLGNVRQKPFSELWEDTSNPIVAGLKDRKAYLSQRCQACKFLSICNGNMRVRAQAATGDVWGDDPACYLTDQEIGTAEPVSV